MQQTRIAAAIAMSLALAACGGGGGGGATFVPGTGLGTGAAPAPSPAPAPAPSPAPGTSPAPAPGTAPAPSPAPDPEPTAKVLLEESFTGLSDLPANWARPAANKGTVSVRDGSLYIDGRADSFAMTAVALPPALAEMSDYRIDVVFTFEAANNNARWGSVMYRSSAATATPAYEPYHQFAIRQNATASNGTEFALRKAGAWTVQSTKAFGSAIDSAKTYTATVIVHGNRARQYLDNVLMHDVTLDAAAPAKGGIGLQTAGLLMRVDSIKVSEQLKPLPEIATPAALQDTGTAAAMAPTLVQPMAASTNLAATGASHALFRIDSTLSLRSANGESLGSLAQYLADRNRATAPVLRVADDAAVDALARYAQENDLSDVTLLSDQVSLLARARTLMPMVRAAVDFSGSGLLDASTQSVMQVVSATNKARAKIAVLPPAMTQRATVAQLQRLLITAWAASSASTPTEAAQVLTSGVNGVLASDGAVFARVMRKLPANTLLRKPLVIGHRGMPQGTGDENTLASAQAAVAAGADVVENDIYLTSDKHLVIMHDDTVDRTTNGTGRIESMTLAQVKQLRTKVGNREVPTLQEYFSAFKGRPITHFIELKSSNTGLVAQLKNELDAAGTRDQAVAISFLGDQLNRAGQTLPELSTGFLNSNADASDPQVAVRNILAAVQPYSSTYNPAYGGLSQATMEAGKHRGITFWPWTINDQAAFHRFYSYGTHGITTDYAFWAKDFPVEISTAATATVGLNTPVALPVTLTTQVGGSIAAQSNVTAVIDGTAPFVQSAEGDLRFTGAGTAVVLPGYRYKMGDGTYSYVIVAKPVSLTVR